MDEKTIDQLKKELNDAKLEIISLKLRITRLENNIELPKRNKNVEGLVDYIPDTLPTNTLIKNPLLWSEDPEKK
jgi:hypothetical protein